MAGYFRRTLENVYEGGYPAHVDLKNGEFVVLDGGVVKKLATTADTAMRIVEKTYLGGLPAVVAEVIYSGIVEVYFVANEWDVEKGGELSDYTVKAGSLVKMKRPLGGEQVVFTVGDTLYGQLSVGDTVGPASGGSVGDFVPEVALKGDKGDKGEDGADGKDGADAPG